MPIKRLRPVLAIAADLPLGRLLTSFRNKDRRTIPWIFSLFHALESQEDFENTCKELERELKIGKPAKAS